MRVIYTSTVIANAVHNLKMIFPKEQEKLCKLSNSQGQNDIVLCYSFENHK